MSSYDGYAPYVEDESVLLTHQGYSLLLANKDARIAQLEANFTKLEASLARYKECLRKFFASTAPDFVVSTLPDELGLNTSVTVELAGQLAGDVSATMSQALSELGDAQSVTVACDRLIRVDLMAAGELLNWVSARRAEGRLVRFTQVHRLVALFFCAMGLDDQAPIELRSL